MRTILRTKTLCAAIAAIFGTTAAAADDKTVISGEATAKLFSFDYYKGVGANSTQFLERYNPQQVAGGDKRNGSYLDFDLSVVGNDGKRDFLVFERQAFGSYNQSNRFKFAKDSHDVKAYYTAFRSATGGIDYLYSPGVVDAVFGVGTGTAPAYSSLAGPVNSQTGYVGQFNSDSPGKTLFKIDRDTYGIGLALKPALFGGPAHLALDYDGYNRIGNRFASYVLGGSNITNSGGADNGTRMRWRGFDKPVNEKMNRYTLNLTGAPGGFVLAYEGTLEKFDNRAAGLLINDIAGPAAPATPRINPSIAPILFIPDSTLVSNNLRIARNFGGTAVAAGYGHSILDQDSFSLQQKTLGYTTGKITTNSAYANITSNVGSVGLAGFVKYNRRKNGSSFPVATLFSATEDQTLGVRINSIRALDYGLSATFRPFSKTTAVVGWKHADKDRDLTWTAVTTVAPLLNGILPLQSTYREDTKSDELYVNLIARPMPGMVVRVTPSVLSSKKTGLLTEPEKAVALKAKVTYTGVGGNTVSGYYNQKDIKNNNNALVSNAAAQNPPAGVSVSPDLDGTRKAAGISLGIPFGEWINTSASLSWMQDDFSSFWLRSGRRRFEAPQNAITFIANDRSEYRIGTYVLTLGGDWQASDYLRWSGNYTWSQSKGHTASGAIFAALPTIDDTIDSTVHSLSLGVDYAVKKNVKLKASYVYEYNKDGSYSALTGGYHTLMLGVGFGF